MSIKTELLLSIIAYCLLAVIISQIIKTTIKLRDSYIKKYNSYEIRKNRIQRRTELMKSRIYDEPKDFFSKMYENCLYRMKNLLLISGKVPQKKFYIDYDRIDYLKDCDPDFIDSLENGGNNAD